MRTHFEIILTKLITTLKSRSWSADSLTMILLKKRQPMVMSNKTEHFLWDVSKREKPRLKTVHKIEKTRNLSYLCFIHLCLKSKFPIVILDNCVPIKNEIEPTGGQMKKFLHTLWKDESAQGATEYILMLVIVVGIAMLFKDKIMGVISSKVEQLSGDIQGVTPTN